MQDQSATEGPCFRDRGALLYSSHCRTVVVVEQSSLQNSSHCRTVVVVEQSSLQTHETFPAAEDFGDELGSGLGPVVVTTLKE